MSKDFRLINKQKIKDESRMYRIFEYTDIPWVILYQSGNKMILQTEYIIDFTILFLIMYVYINNYLK